MQVELAQLEYLMPRLLGKGLILSQQGAGIGTSGPGETKLEVDRRRIRARIEKLKEDLRHVKMHRAIARKNARKTIPRQLRLSVTPMPANRPCLMPFAGVIPWFEMGCLQRLTHYQKRFYYPMV